MNEFEQNQVQSTDMSVGDWLITLILTAIPLVGIIMLFVWAFGSSEKKSRSNWAKAALIVAAIGLVLYIIFMVVFGAAIISAMPEQM